jgi:hypothetical protein
MAALRQELTEKDLAEAVDLWLAANGLRRVAESVMFTINKGDRPGESDSISASVAVVSAAKQPTPPATRKRQCGCGAPSCDTCHGG